MVGLSSRASNGHLYNMKYLIREQGKSGVKIKMEKNRGIEITQVPQERYRTWWRFVTNLMTDEWVRRRICGELICMYKIMHGLLDFPCDSVFAAPTRIGLRGHIFKIHQQRCKTWVQRSSIPVLEQAARGDFERSIRGGIQVATGCTVAVPLLRSSPLTRLPILPPEFVPSGRIPPLCYYSNYTWLPISSPCTPMNPSNLPPLTTHSLSTHWPT